MSTRLDQLKKITELLGSNVTTEEFVKNFKFVVDFVKKIKVQNDNEVKQLKALFSALSKELKSINTNSASELKQSIQGEIKAFKAILETKNKEIDTKMAAIKDGKDADEEMIVNEVLSRIEIPEIEDIADQLPRMGEEVRDSLELLNGDDRLRWEAIRGLKEKFEELQEKIDNIPLGRGGGGTSDLGVRMSLSRLVKTETPSGDIDGTNKSYTVTGTIGAVMSFAINGMVIHDDEYTTSGSTITFTTALPAALSGKSFRIVYV